MKIKPLDRELLSDLDLENMGLRSRSTSRNLRWSGKEEIPYIKYGRSVRYRREDVLKFIKKKGVK